MADCCHAATIWSGDMLMMVTACSSMLACFRAPISEKWAVEPTGTAMRLPFRSASVLMPVPLRTIKDSDLPMT